MANRNPSRSSRFKPGAEWTGNAKGRPPGKSLTAKLRDMLDQTSLEGHLLPEGQTIAEMVAKLILRKALGGDFLYVVELLNRTDGKVRDRAKVPMHEDGGSDRRQEEAIEMVFGLRPTAQLPEELERNWKSDCETNRFPILKAAV